MRPRLESDFARKGNVTHKFCYIHNVLVWDKMCKWCFNPWEIQVYRRGFTLTQ